MFSLIMCYFSIPVKQSTPLPQTVSMSSEFRIHLQLNSPIVKWTIHFLNCRILKHIWIFTKQIPPSDRFWMLLIAFANDIETRQTHLFCWEPGPIVHTADYYAYVIIASRHLSLNYVCGTKKKFKRNYFIYLIYCLSVN